MLHILWMIIKVILIIIGILLGLILLAVLFILFCPVRYQAHASKQAEEWKKTQITARISWLFHGISICFHYTEGVLDYQIRLFGISLNKFLKKEKTKDPKEKKAQIEEKPSDEQSSAEASFPKPESACITETEQPVLGSSDTEAAVSSKEMPKFNFFSDFVQRMKVFFQKIVHKLKNIAVTIRNIYTKIDWWKAFIHHPKTKEALSYVMGHMKYVLKHILPTRMEGNVTFGNEDPYITGMILAVLGTTIPLHKNCITVIPLFEGENIAVGNVDLRGRIYGFVLIRAAIEIYLNKNVKYVIHKWRHKEG